MSRLQKPSTPVHMKDSGGLGQPALFRGGVVGEGVSYHCIERESHKPPFHATTQFNSS